MVLLLKEGGFWKIEHAALIIRATLAGAIFVLIVRDGGSLAVAIIFTAEGSELRDEDGDRISK